MYVVPTPMALSALMDMDSTNLVRRGPVEGDTRTLEMEVQLLTHVLRSHECKRTHTHTGSRSALERMLTNSSMPTTVHRTKQMSCSAGVLSLEHTKRRSENKKHLRGSARPRTLRAGALDAHSQDGVEQVVHVLGDWPRERREKKKGGKTPPPAPSTGPY